jgi:hypothetical protein
MARLGPFSRVEISSMTAEISDLGYNGAAFNLQLQPARRRAWQLARETDCN